MNAPILDWNNLSEKDKVRLSQLPQLVLIPGPVHMSRKRIKQIVSELSNSTILFGCLKDEEIPGLAGSIQFLPLQLAVLKQALKQNKRVSILWHFHKDTKYIIKELKPRKVLFVNGSWSGQIHYQS